MRAFFLDSLKFKMMIPVGDLPSPYGWNLETKEIYHSAMKRKTRGATVEMIKKMKSSQHALSAGSLGMYDEIRGQIILSNHNSKSIS